MSTVLERWGVEGPDGVLPDKVFVFEKAAQGYVDKENTKKGNEALEAIPIVISRGWTPVTQALPKRSIRCLVCIPNAYAGEPIFITTWYDAGRGRWDEVGTGVTHWQPAPAAP